LAQAGLPQAEGNRGPMQSIIESAYVVSNSEGLLSMGCTRTCQCPGPISSLD